MSISILVKVKEFTEFWRRWLNELYELEKSMPPLQGDELIPDIKNRYSLADLFMIKHIRYLREVKHCVESDNATFKDFEYVLDRAFDYFIDTYDGMSGALRCMKIDKSIREILSDEEAQKNHYLRGIEYRNRIISMYKKGLEDLLSYLEANQSENDGYQVNMDVQEIVEDIEKAVDKAGEL